MLGLGVQVTGIAENVRRLGRVPALADTASRKALITAARDGKHMLADTILRMPQRRDPFWGVMGTDSPVGLGIRTGKTRQRITGGEQAYIGAGSTLYTFIASPDSYMKALEEGGTIHERTAIPTAAAQTPSGADRWPGGGPPGSFIWPTAKMKNFMNGTPRNRWLVIAAPKTGRGRDRAQRGGKHKLSAQGPLLPNAGGLTFLKLFKDSVTVRPHGSFMTLRTMMEPRMGQLGVQVGAEIVKGA